MHAREACQPGAVDFRHPDIPRVTVREALERYLLCARTS
jgi:hypothetical protein